MARMTPLRLLVLLILVAVTPLIYIAAFNYFFNVGIAYTIDNWLLVFLVGILMFILFLVFEVIAFGVGKVLGPLGVLLAILGLFLIPVLYIFSFNLVLRETVPINVTSYILVAVTILGIGFGSRFIYSRA